MQLLAKVLASIIRRVLLGAALSALTVLVARGLIDVDLRDEILAWLDGDAVSWIVTILIALAGSGLTWLDKYVTKLKLEAAQKLPSNASDRQIEREAKADAPAAIAPFVKMTLVIAACGILLTGCSSFTRVHVLIGDTVKQDAANALLIAEQSGDKAMEQCAATTLEAAGKAPKAGQITGVLSGIAAKRAHEVLLEAIRRDCGEVYLAARGTLLRIGLFGMF